MKKILVIFLSFALGIGAMGQQKKATPHVKSKPPGLSPEKLKMLCKPWKLDTVENFGVPKPATAKEQNDGVTFLADSTLFLTMEGVVKTGKWMTGWSPKIINTVTGDNKEKMMFTIMSLSDNYMELEYQTPDLIRTHYFYSAKRQ